MRIPLDYYQILGIPTVATMGQIQQAYADRNLQQPRHEYNSTAIESRQKLLSDAYEILAHPAERSQYDAVLMEAYPHFNAGENPLTNLDLEQDRVLGGLLMLAETGEYEKLLSIAWPLLADEEAVKQAMGSGSLEETWNALYLTVALTLLELGRERWRQNRPGEGCEALETSIKLLRQQNIYPTVQAEIQRELYKFRPQYILSVLSADSKSPKAEAERQQVLVLLQELIVTSANPHGYNVYGMTQDGFIAYLDQIRRHLTTHEQQALFEEPATQSGNPIFTYLLVYAMVARGFYYQMPELIYRAQELLSRHLSRRQDVFVEQALCFLLLGQTTEAQMALSRSSDRESLAYIHKNSSSSDLLPGLCRYSELWFQTQVFPHFSDLVNHRVSLNTYFENLQVQAYLNDLPVLASGALNAEVPVEMPELETFNQVASGSAGSNNYRGSVPLMASLGISEPLVQTQLSGELPQANRTSGFTISSSGGISPDNVVPFERPKKKREPMPTEEATLLRNPGNSQLELLSEAVGGQLAAIRSKEIVPRKNASLARRRRHKQQLQLLLVGLAGLMGALALVTWMGQMNKSTKLARSSSTPAQVSPPVAPVVSGGVGMATTVSKTTAASPSPTQSASQASLTLETAQSVVEKWLSAKSKSLSASYDVSTLAGVLAEPALSRAKTRSQEAKSSGARIDYKHQAKVQSVEPPLAPGKHNVEALINESASYYDNSQLVKSLSYQKNLRLKYELINQGGQWLIKDMTVIQ
jgi:hypothetical protein